MAAKSRGDYLGHKSGKYYLDAEAANNRETRPPEQNRSYIYREKLKHVLYDPWLQLGVVLLVIVDLFIVLALLLIHLKIIQVPQAHRDATHKSTNNTTSGAPSASIENTENSLHYINIVILTVFLIEILLRIVTKGRDFIKDIFEIFDALLVLGLFILYITLSHALDDKLGRCVVGFFIVLRLWRFSRVIEGFIAPYRHDLQVAVRTRLQVQQQAQEQAQILQAKLDQQHMEIESLRLELRLQGGAKSTSSSSSTPVSHVRVEKESESGQSGFKEFVEKTTQTILEMVATDLEDQLREEDGSQSASPQPNGSIPSLAGTTPSSQSSPLSSKEGLNVLGSKSGGSSESIEAGYQSDKSNRPFRRRRSAGKMSKRRKSGDSKAGDKELWQDAVSKDDFAYLNPAFLASLSEEELAEIKRVSLVEFEDPYEPSGNDNIPTTDL